MTHPIKSALILILLLGATAPVFALKRSELVPSDARFDVTISDTTAFLNKLKQAPIGKLWKDPQFQDFLDNPDDDIWFELFFRGGSAAENKIMREQTRMLKGEVVFALDQDDEQPYLLVAMNNADFQHSLVLDEQMAEMVERPITILKDTFQGVEIVQHISNAGTPGESSSWQANLNNTLVMGPSREWVEKSIVRLQEEPIEEPTGNPVLNISVPVASLIKRTILEWKTNNQNTTTPINIETLFESLGLMGIEKFTSRIELKNDEMLIDSNLKATSLGKGIFTIFDMRPAELPSVGFVPENITTLEVGRLNLLRFWQEIPMAMMAVMPEAKPQFDMALAMIRQQVGIDVEHDLLAHMGTKYLSFSVIENNELLSVYAIDLKDGQAFLNGFENLMAAPAIQPQIAAAFDTGDFLGHMLYVSKSTDPSEQIAFAIVGDHFLYGQPDGVRQVIRNLSRETAENSRFEQNALVQGLRRHVPDDAFGYSVVDWKKNMPFIVQELNKPAMRRTIMQRWTSSGIALPPPDFSKLPPSDHLASFFNTSYQYVEKTDQGLHHMVIVKY